MSIAEFYSGKNLLITGCTGFVGKVVLEKIMRSLPNFNKIFILIRPKKGISPASRA
jgi:fatty acyl-CoA reductase